MDIPVTLIVKAPNQQFEDQTIKCELSWTIRKLKGYLSEVYPCKPSTEEQKLIYSGQLLHDAIVLKDVLRTYEEEVDAPQIHTVHLVYTPKYKPKSTTSSDSNKTNSDKTMPPVISTTDGLRQRNVPSTSNTGVANQSATSSVAQQQQQQQNIPSTPAVGVTSGCGTGGNSSSDISNNNNNYLNGMQNFMNIPNILAQQQFNPNYAAQQLAMQNWMHMQYMQYLNQYMNLVQMGGSPGAIFHQQTTVPAMSSTAFYPQHIDPLSVINQPQSLSIPAPQVQPAPVPQAQQQQAAGQAIAADVQPVAAADAVPLQAQNQQNAPPQPRFPNIVIDDNQDNRDWLDRFYTISRLILFITLIYFYSSPIRCLIVMVVGICLYLYNAGMFRMNGEINNNNQRQQPQPNQRAVAPAPAPAAAAAAAVVQQQPRADNNNNPVVGDNNNNVVDAAPPQAVELGGDDNEAVADNDGQPLLNQNNNATLENNNSAENSTAAEDVETRSILSFIRTFVVSFFTSLIPEPPAL